MIPNNFPENAQFVNFFRKYPCINENTKNKYPKFQNNSPAKPIYKPALTFSPDMR